MNISLVLLEKKLSFNEKICCLPATEPQSFIFKCNFKLVDINIKKTLKSQGGGGRCTFFLEETNNVM